MHQTYYFCPQLKAPDHSCTRAFVLGLHIAVHTGTYMRSCKVSYSHSQSSLVEVSVGSTINGICPSSYISS